MSDTPTTETPQVPLSTGDNSQPFYAYPGKKDPSPPKKRRNKLGCVLMSLFTLVMVTVLVVIGLFLPPISLGDRLFGTRFIQLDSVNNAIALTSPSGGNDFTLILNPNDIGREFGVALTRLATSDFLNTPTTNADSWIPLARATLPRGIALKSDIYSITTTGTVPQSITLLLSVPDGMNNPDLIDIYAWDETRRMWYFLPSRMTNTGGISAQVDVIPQHVAVFEAQSTDPIIATVLESGQGLPPQYPDMVNILMPVGMTPALPSATGQTVVGNVVGGFELGALYRVMPVIRNYNDPRAVDVETVIQIITNPELAQQHVTQLANFANSGGYSGIFIDYRDIPAEHRTAFTNFVRNLGKTFNSLTLRLGIIVPAAETIEGRWETGAYDWRALGMASDFIYINFTLNPTTFANGRDRLVEAMTRWAIGEVSRNKLLAGLSALSIRESSGGFIPIHYDDAFTLLGDVKIDPPPIGAIAQGQELTLSLSGADALLGMDTTVQTPFLDYIALDGSALARVWLTTDNALRFRMENFRPFAIGGIGFPDLLHNGTMQGILEAVQNHKIQQPTPSSESLELSLKWRIEGFGNIIGEFTSTLGESVPVTLIAPDGNYAVNVEVVSGEDSSPRRGVSVALAQATITPTLIPFSTPRPQPTLTPTLMAIVPTPSTQDIIYVTPDVGGGSSAIRPGAGSILRGFEYGGHVTGTGSQRAVSAMRSAGMTWMKVQVRYGVGSGIGEAADAIRQAHANGFKVMLGLVGFPNQMGDLQSYIPQFAQWAGDIAALGPDAIEVWNEPNLDREWARQHLSGANFTALLRATHNEIRRRNPNVTIIAGAPAPTGAEGAFPGQVINDDRFLREMVSAGAINYMDCMGLHYNEGIVPPRVTTGDPRGDYYTRYLPSIIDTYWSILGGRVPLCITELGYVTPEGYGSLPPFFAWGNNTSVAQQAAWLAGAVSYASQTGRVRLLIVWNVDFTNYDANDPMAGYAIIRPDGSCPACSAIANAR